MVTVQTGERQHETGSDGTATGVGPGATWLSVGGVVGAAASGACCVIPFALVTVGVSGGVWLGRLTALAPYQPFFITATLLCLAAGFVLVRRPSRASCPDGVACARPGSLHLVRIALWVATVLVAAALLFPYAVRPLGEG